MALQDRLRQHHNLAVVIASSFLAGLETSIVNVVWQPFVLSLGAPMSALGLLSSIGGYNGVIPTLGAPTGGWLADQRGRRIVLLGASVCMMAGLALYTVAGVAGAAAMLVPGIVFVGLAGISRPVSSALTGESVRAGRQGTAYSLVLVANTMPGILAPLAAGWLADRTRYVAIFPVALVAEIVSFYLIARYLREIVVNTAREFDWRGLANLLRRAWRPPAGLRGLFVIAAMDSFAWGLGWGLLYGLFTKEYHFDAARLGILSSVTSLTWVVIQLPIGRIVDRQGSKRILAISEGLGAPLMLLWITQSRFEVLALSMALFAANAALWIPARNTYVTRAVAPERRAEAFGRLAAFAGLLAFPAPFIGGFLFDRWGFTAPLYANLLGSIITFFVIVFFVHEPRSTSI